MKVSSENLFFTSDTHFFHENIIRFCSRPFENAEHMRKSLIKNWNDTVPENGVVFHLGDFALTGKINWIGETIEKLNGTIHLVLGNHDMQNRYQRAGILSLFESVSQQLYLEVLDKEINKEQGLFLCHYPMITWHNFLRGAWQLYGHIHSGPLSTASEKDYVASRLNERQYDVGVDNNDYRPVSYDEIKNIINNTQLNVSTK